VLARRCIGRKYYFYFLFSPPNTDPEGIKKTHLRINEKQTHLPQKGKTEKKMKDL
jgi:hypothetical protein